MVYLKLSKNQNRAKYDRRCTFTKKGYFIDFKQVLLTIEQEAERLSSSMIVNTTAVRKGPTPQEVSPQF